MNKGDQTSVDAALDGLLSVGTVRGVCLARGGEILANRFPFSDSRLLNLCAEVEQILKTFAECGRALERMVLGFDGGHLVLLIDGDIRLLIMHLFPDEADFIAKAGQAFLVDHGEAISSREALPIEIVEEAEIEAESKVETETPAEGASAAVIVEGASKEERSLEAAAARNVQPSERENPQLVVSKPEMAELPLEGSSAGEGDGKTGGFRELLEASRQQQVYDAILATGSEDETVDDSDDSDGSDDRDDMSEEDRALAAWAAEHLDLPEDASHLLPPKQSAKPPHRSFVGRAVVGAVTVQPVRLAAQQPQSTLPPPKKPRVRRSKASVGKG